MPPGQRRAAETLIEQFRATLPHPLDDFQLEAIQALANGRSVLVAAPTGTGKTVIADFGAFQARTAGLRAFYTTPIKALSNQKYRDYRAIYGDEVGLLTGDISLNADAPIVIMTTEVLRNKLVTGATLADVGTIVFDEVHYMGDAERGRPGRSRSCWRRGIFRWCVCRRRCPTRPKSPNGSATRTAISP